MSFYFSMLELAPSAHLSTDAKKLRHSGLHIQSWAFLCPWDNITRQKCSSQIDNEAIGPDTPASPQSLGMQWTLQVFPNWSSTNTNPHWPHAFAFKTLQVVPSEIPDRCNRTLLSRSEKKPMKQSKSGVGEMAF